MYIHSQFEIWRQKMVRRCLSVCDVISLAVSFGKEVCACVCSLSSCVWSRGPAGRRHVARPMKIHGRVR